METRSKFVIDRAGGDPLVLVGDCDLEVHDVGEDGHIFAECDYEVLSNASFDDFPDGLTIRIQSSDGFGTFLFHEVEVARTDSIVLAEHICHHPNKYWEGRWGLSTLLQALRDQLKFVEEAEVGSFDLEDDWKRISIRIPVAPGSARAALDKNAELLNSMVHDAEAALAGIRWKPAYETDERAFCEEILTPLLRRMGFLGVRYTQGAREYGKDFTFSELTPFGMLRHFGLQAKAGDVRGNVNSAIDELVGQADDAFKMPYVDLTSAEERYISTFIVAISGKFTENAKEKITHKVPRGLHGSMVFLDREALLELIDRYWKL